MNLQKYYTGMNISGIRIGIITTDKYLTAIKLNSKLTKKFLKQENIIEKDTPPGKKVKKQLQEYFEGKRKKFDLPVKTEGTEFRKKIWKRLAAVPYGKTVSYKQLAEKAGSPSAARAAGGACGANPIPIVIPCHRVLNSGGGLGGYSAGKTPDAGLKIKKQLLDLEKNL